MSHVHAARASRKVSAPLPRTFAAVEWVKRCLFLADEAMGRSCPADAASPLQYAFEHMRSVPAGVREPLLRHGLDLLAWKAEMEVELGSAVPPSTRVAPGSDEEWLDTYSLHTRLAEDAAAQPRRYDAGEVQRLLGVALRAAKQVVGNLRCSREFFVTSERVVAVLDALRSREAAHTSNVVRVDFGARRVA